MGVFPMADDDGRILWFSPDPRGILPLDEFHIPHGLARRLERDDFEIRLDTRFDDVVDACAARERTWISPSIRRCYGELHRMGAAHSVECWIDEHLAGGLYGVSIRGAFFGESMFHRETDASKLALVALVRHLRRRGFLLLDTQWTTPHLEQFGGKEIPRLEYLDLLEEALESDVGFF